MPRGAIYDEIEKYRRQLLRNERVAASQIVREYGQTWTRIKAQIEKLDAQYKKAMAAGLAPGPGWAYEMGRAKSLRDLTEIELNKFVKYAEKSVIEQQRLSILSAGEHAERLTRLQLGKIPKGINVIWNGIDTKAVETIIGMTRLNSPLHRLLSSISATGAKAAEDALIEGMILGQNPRAIAPIIRDALGTELSRALTISRTETLRAGRVASSENYKANNDIVDGWIWDAALDDRTCESCWAMHGTIHSNDEVLDGHPNCRCSEIPKTKSWEEIGATYGVDLSGMEQHEVKIESGESLFGKLSDSRQQDILGESKWQAWKDGLFEFSDLSHQTESADWGTMRTITSLQDLIGENRMGKYQKW